MGTINFNCSFHASALGYGVEKTSEKKITEGFTKFKGTNSIVREGAAGSIKL